MFLLGIIIRPIHLSANSLVTIVDMIVIWRDFEKLIAVGLFVSFCVPSQNLRKTPISFVMSACLSVRVEQLGFQWRDFREI